VRVPVWLQKRGKSEDLLTVCWMKSDAENRLLTKMAFAEMSNWDHARPTGQKLVVYRKSVRQMEICRGMQLLIPSRRAIIHRFLLRTSAVLVVSFGFVSGEEASLLQVRDGAYLHVSEIRSVEYQGRVELYTGAVWDVSVERSGAKYRVSRVDVSPSLIQGEKIVGSYHEFAFDGIRHQAMDERDATMADRSYIQVSDKQFQSGVTDLLLRPFQWLTSCSCVQLEWSEIQTHGLWEKNFANATDRGEGFWKAEKCRLVDFPQSCSEDGATFRVYFSIEKDFYPVAYERRLDSTGAVCSSYVLDAFKQISLENRSMFIPIHGTRSEVSAASKAVLLSRFQVLPDKLKLNEPIVDTRFTLVPSKKPIIYDIDQEEELRRQSIEARQMPLPYSQTTTWRKLLLPFNLLVAAVALWMIWRKRSVK